MRMPKDDFKQEIFKIKPWKSQTNWLNVEERKNRLKILIKTVPEMLNIFLIRRYKGRDGKLEKELERER